ncbi:hypothetical protein [Bradyrhizobium sp. URHC0002]
MPTDNPPLASPPPSAAADPPELKASSCACNWSTTDCSADARASNNLAWCEMLTVVTGASGADDDVRLYTLAVLPLVPASAAAVPVCEIDKEVYE